MVCILRVQRGKMDEKRGIIDTPDTGPEKIPEACRE
jgi:hypothetical protein